MTEENEDVLRRSLASIDRRRNWLLGGVVLTAVLLVGGFAQATRAIETHSQTLLLHAVMLILGIWTTMMTLVVVMQVTAMTKRILRAIELAAKQ